MLESKHRCRATYFSWIYLNESAVEDWEEVDWGFHRVLEVQKTHVGENHEVAVPLVFAKHASVEELEIPRSQRVYKVVQLTCLEKALLGQTDRPYVLQSLVEFEHLSFPTLQEKLDRVADNDFGLGYGTFTLGKNVDHKLRSSEALQD